jgi:penicillin-binding protein 1C
VVKKKRHAILLLAPLAGMVVWLALPEFFPIPSGLLEPAQQSPQLLDRNGEVLRRLALPDARRSSGFTLDEVPRELREATLAAEDKRFFSHRGVDYLAIARALRDGGSGASTITQQLVKISSPPARRGVLTKMREAMSARHLEREWDKERILAEYLKRLDYGHQRIGAAEAARAFCGKPLADLSLAESAMLAGLPQAPSRLSPQRHPQAAKGRRDRVLGRMLRSFGYDPTRIAAAVAEPLPMVSLEPPAVAPHLPDLLARLQVGGSQRTTLDGALQGDLERVVQEELKLLAKENVQQAAVVVIDVASGEILALIGSGDFADPRGGQLNGALLPRSAGSTLKPFTYALGFDRGQFPGSIVADVPLHFFTPEGLDGPMNFDRRHHGPVTIRHALGNSLNVAAMWELNQVGGPRALHRLLLRCGLTTLDADPSRYGLGLTIGNAPVNLVELTNAYACIARLGRFRSTRLLESSEPAAERQALAPEVAWMLADILADNAARQEAFGSHSLLELPFRCGVKTGTSSDYRDNWCVGFTGKYAVGVWAGNFDHSAMRGVSGVAGAGPIFHRTMVRLHRGEAATWPAEPAGLVRVAIDPRNGKKVPAGSRHAVMEICRADQHPLAADRSDYDADGRALLDLSYREWFESPDNHRRGLFALAVERPSGRPLRILSPQANAVYLLDPELPSGGRRLRLLTDSGQTLVWTSPTLEIDAASDPPAALLVPGTHTIVLTEPASGQSVSRAIRVDVQ